MSAPPPLRSARAPIETDETNQRERGWWNEHAALMARVWEMHREVSWKAREGYLRRAREFFLAGRAQATVLELGCGSGWVGQSIAGDGLSIIGTDFSQSQIDLATRSAAQRGLSGYCRYAMADSAKWPDDLQAVDGVLVHAFMHHLDGGEIGGLLESLRANLAKGTRIWFYEPAFYLAPPAAAHGLPAATRVALDRAGRLVAWLSGIYRRRALLDQETYAAFLRLQQQAAEQGWYLSPKEVPFDVAEFSAQLAARFRVARSYWATVYLIGWVFETNLLKSDRLRSIAARTVVPLLRRADERIARAEDYLRASLVAPAHAFRVWECEVA